MSKRAKKLVIFSVALCTILAFTFRLLAADPAQLVFKATTSKKVIALTFDDCNDQANTQALLDILEQNGEKATFAPTGQAAETYPDLIRQMAGDGDCIINHTYSHPDLSQLTHDEIVNELNAADQAIMNITGKTTKPYFRTPYFSYNDTVAQAAGDAGYGTAVMWTINTEDWKGISAADITSIVLSQAIPGAIVVMHANGTSNSRYALQDIINGLKAMGYSLVTVDELLSPEKKLNVFAGSDRYSTAVAISSEMYSTASTAILATGSSFPDALAAGPLAVQLDAPVLLTDTSSLPQSTLDELKRLGTSKVIIMGGETAVGPEVVSALSSAGISVERVSGSDRFGTAVEAAKKVRASSGVTSKAVLAYGWNFPDALSIGSYAAANGIPVLLTDTSSLTASTKAALQSFGINEVVIAGGASVVSQDVVNELTAMGISVTRVSGTTRFGTADAIAGTYFPTAHLAIVAYGWNFPDALAAVPLSVKNKAPILLVEQSSIPSEVSSYILNSPIYNIYVVGGDPAVGPEVKAALRTLIQ